MGYPVELHDAHNDYPCAPERLKIDKVEKLVTTFLSKKNYVVHHLTLKKYIELGLRVTKIHRGVSFKESEWLAPYIMLKQIFAPRC